METLRGTVISSWRRSEDSLRLEVTVPVGSEAEIHVPKLGLRGITVAESDTVIWKEGAYQPGSPGLAGGRETDRAVIFQAGAGSYVFEMRGQ